MQSAPNQAAPPARAHSATQDPADRPVHATTLLEMPDWHVHRHPVQLDFDAPMRAADVPLEPFPAAVALRDAARAAMSQRLGEKGEGAAAGASP